MVCILSLFCIWSFIACKFASGVTTHFTNMKLGLCSFAVILSTRVCETTSVLKLEVRKTPESCKKCKKKHLAIFITQILGFTVFHGFIAMFLHFSCFRPGPKTACRVSCKWRRAFLTNVPEAWDVSKMNYIENIRTSAGPILPQN